MGRLTDTIKIVWCVDDVLGMDKAQEHKLTNKEARRVLELQRDNYDASIGVNWDTLEYWILEVVNERK